MTAMSERMRRPPNPLTPLEIVGGFPYGIDSNAPELPAPSRRSPLEAIEDAVLQAISRPPCVVSFSGGRDSSAVLAVATSLARRHGLPEPVPVTLRFPGPDSHESTWQERVVEFLGLRDWTCIDLTDELDSVGPVAGAVLRRYGVLWPPNNHFHVPILDVARGGSMLTGIDGDGLLASWRWARMAKLLTGNVRPRRRDARLVLRALAPSTLRVAVDNRRFGEIWPWVRPDTSRLIARRWNADKSTEPLVWSSWVRWYSRRRSLRLTVHSMDLIAKERDVLAVHPLADNGFLSEFAAGRRWRGYPDRTASMVELFGELLPPEIITRRSKAHFDQTFSNRFSREFITDWGGAGLDESLVDVEALRSAWSEPPTPSATGLLLQTAWLASQDLGSAVGERSGEPGFPDR